MIETLLTWICFLFALPVGIVLVAKPSILARMSENPEEQKKRELPIRVVGGFFVLLAVMVMI